MPQFRDYPEATSILPGDAFLIDRPGVGTMYILESATNFSTIYDIAMGFPETIPPNVVILAFNVVRPIYLPAGLTGSEFSLQTAPSSDFVLTLLQNGNTIGTVDFPASSLVGTPTFAAKVTFAAGDEIRIQTPSSTYGALGFSCTLAATRL